MNERNTKWKTMSEILEDFLSQYDKEQYYKKRESIQRFLSFIGKDIDNVVREYNQAEDKNQWAREMGQQLVKFYKAMTKEGYAINTARTWTIGFRTFCSEKLSPLIIKRKAIHRPTIALDEHNFLLVELQQIYHCADLFDKTLLSLGVCLGYSAKDFLELKRNKMEQIVNHAVSNKIDFPSLDFYRAKTGIMGRSFLTPEAIRNLELYLETTKPNENDSLFDLSHDALNDHLKNLVKTANIQTRGLVKWHLLRKFLFTNLLKAMDILSAKILMGKKVESDLATYLQQNEEDLRQKYIRAYSYIKLESNGNGRVSNLEEELSIMKEALTSVEKENLLFKTRIDNLQNVMKGLEDKVTQYGEWLTNWVEFSKYTQEEKQAIRRKLNLREYSEEEKEMMKLFVATAKELEEENGMVDAKKFDREFKARLKRRLRKDDH